MHTKLLLFTLSISFIFSQNNLRAQPANDNCANASSIVIGGGGYSLGTFTSGNSDLTNATIQSGETFYSTIQSAGQTAKSVWFKFTLLTARKCTLSLKQPTPLIAGNDAGFTVYLSNTCFPTSQQADDALLASQTLFGWSANPCLKPGDYLVQVSANNAANGPVFIELQLQDPDPAPYDKPAGAYDFGVMNGTPCEKYVDVNLGCYSLDVAAEVCGATGSGNSQSVWYTFTTDSYYDYMGIAYGSVYGSSSSIYGYRLYRGDAKTQPLSSLTLVDGCKADTIDYSTYNPNYNLYQKIHHYPCGSLLTNTTYSIQIIADKNSIDLLRLFIQKTGTQAGSSPRPVTTGIAANNKLGILPAGNTNRTDYFACNTRLSVNGCGNTNPAAGVYIPASGVTYNMAIWYTFELSQSSNVFIDANIAPNYNPPPYVRIFNKDVNTLCNNLDTATNLIYAFADQNTINCLPAGKYSIQILGNQSINNGPCYWSNNLGQPLDLMMTVTPVQPSNRFSLMVNGAVDTIRRVGALFGSLQPDTINASKTDTFGCGNTVLPAGGKCDDRITKAIYSEFQVADSGFVNFTFSPSWNYYQNWNIVYRGNAMSLSNAQNKHFYPDSILGLTPVTPCIGNPGSCGNIPKTCVTPGIYTMVNFGDSTHIGQTSSTTYQLDKRRTIHYSATLAEDLGNILDTLSLSGSNSLISQTDWFTCLDNPLTIGGQAPCDGLNGIAQRTKLIYRQFYLSQPKYVSISATSVYCRSDVFTLFNGKATNGVNTLTPVGNPWICTRAATSPPCIPLAAGWYTIVSYGEGPSYANPLGNYNGYSGMSGDVGFENWINISIIPPPAGPKYNRPAKACIDTLTNLPFVLKTGNRGTAAVPVTDTTYQFYTEYFDCTTDTPFFKHPLKACDSISHVRVAYYLFTLAQESYLRFSGLGDANLICQIYSGNARTTPNILLNNNPVQPCVANGDWIQMCRMQPGTYTLVVLVPDNYNGSSITPSVYVDMAGYSRFDHAFKAYDFGLVSPDSLWHNGKSGDVNPLNPLRAPSNDIFYCTTGAQITDPPYVPCYTDYNPNVYNSPPTNNHFYDFNYPGNSNYPRRNLWYTFLLNAGGNCRVRINGLTPNKPETKFTVYKSDVNGNLPFSTVVSTGQVDSTVAQGLTEIVTTYSYYCSDANEVQFYRDPCSAGQDRYYILVDGKYEPNYQVEVEILWDTIYATQPKYDFYSSANVINGLNQTVPPYTNVNLGPGTYAGAKDNFTCATYSPLSDNLPCGVLPQNKTLWYKFRVSQSGQLRVRYQINGADGNPESCQATIYRQMLPGDSTSTGLTTLGYTDANYYDPGTGLYWNSRCITPGTYYLMFTGYYRSSEDVQPIIWVVDQDGDYCQDPVAGNITGPGAVTLSSTIDCHTIGEGFGEDGSNMACLLPIGANVADYKSTWFRFDVTGNNDTFDITPVLNNLTNVASNSIRYRLLYGSCSAMNTGSCFVSANTVNTFNCLAKGSYFIQVVTPNYNLYGQWSTGQIEMTVNAVKSPPGCNPVNTCFALANFTTSSPCNTDTVFFLNQSTSGDSIRYLWKLGYNNLTDTVKNPKVIYPVSGLSQSYTVKLYTTNIKCNKTDSTTKIITVFKKPKVNLGLDTSLCSPNTITLRATSYPGTTYLWQDGSMDSVYAVSSTGQYFVADSFNGCTVYDTVNITVNPQPVADLGPDQILCPGQNYNGYVYQGVGESYLWSDSSNNYSFSTSTSGTYWVRINVGNCIASDTIIISALSSVQPLGNDTTICNGNPVMLDATTSGASSYLWDDGSTNSTRIVSAGGTYSVDISINGCTLSDTILVNSVVITPPSITGNNLLTCATTNSILTATSSISGATYNWGGGVIAPTKSVTLPGVYTVTVTNPVNGCTASASDTVKQNITKPNITIASPASLTCTTASVLLAASSTTSGATYNWGGGITTSTKSVAAPGNYRVTATDPANGCTDTASANVIQNILTPNLTVSATGSISCINTVVTLTAASSTAGATFNWGGGNTSAAKNVTASGIYSVTATDPLNGCTVSVVDTVTQNITTPNVSIAASDTLTCTNTSVMIMASSTTTGATFNWGGGITTATKIVSVPGTYTVTVTDPSNGCTASASTTANQLTAPPNVSIGTPATLTCTITSVMLTASSTTTGAIYNWGGGITTATNTVSSAATYTVTVTDPSNSCTATASATVNQVTTPPNVSIVAPATLTCSISSVTLTASSTTPGVTFDWGAGITTATNTVTQPNTYSVTATDPSNSCTATATATVNRDTITPNVSIATPATLTCSTSSITLTASSTTPGVTYNWGGGNNTSTSTVITTASYGVTVTNPANGCTASTSAIVIQNISLPDVSIATPGTLTCNNAAVTLTASSTTPGVTYNWGGGVITATKNVSQPGIYTVTVTDTSNGCTANASVNVNQVASPPNVSIASPATLTCVNTSVTLTASSTTPGVIYNWGGGITTPTNPVSAASSYTVTVTDPSNNCTATASVAVSQQTTTPNISVVTPASLTCINARVILVASSTTLGVTYLWSTGTTISSDTVSSPNTYSVTVTDPANGCTASSSATVSRNITTPNVSITPPAALDCSNSTVTLTASSSVNGALYSWGAGINTPLNTVSSAGIYRVTVTDPTNGCSDSASVTVTQNITNPNLSIAPPGVLTCTNTSVALTASSTTSGVIYNWGGGIVTNSRTVSTGGTYSVTVTDPANNCSTVDSIVVNQNVSIPNVSITSSGVLTCASASIILTASSITPGVTFDWGGGSTGVTRTVSIAGNYSVTATDPGNGCTASSSALVNQASPVTATSVVVPVKCAGQSSGSIDITVLTGTPAYSFVWSNGATTQNLSNVIAGNYSVTITDSNNCTLSLSSLTVTEPQAISITLIPTDETCLNAGNGSITSAVTGGTSPYNYQWSNGSGAANLNSLNSGNYSLKILDSNGCTNSATTTVKIDNDITVNAEVNNPICPPKNDGYINLTISGGVPPYRFSWSSNQTSQNLNGLYPGSYTVTITDALGCQADTGFSLAYQYTLTLLAPSDITIQLGQDTSLYTTTNGSQLQYLWIPSTGLDCDHCAAPQASPIVTTQYTVKAEDNNGCKASDTVTVFVILNHDIYIPNVFTPNQDGNNDYFEIFGNKKSIRFLNVRIFDRWGEKVFESNDISFKWDGVYRGELLDPGVYAYEVRIVFPGLDQEKIYKGGLTLLR